MSRYLIKDEFNQAMRIVGKREEAIAICELRDGWTFTRIKELKPANPHQFEDAPF
jgi:hypothetical protein